VGPLGQREGEREGRARACAEGLRELGLERLGHAEEKREDGGPVR
jgi:hypothetical protein